MKALFFGLSLTALAAFFVLFAGCGCGDDDDDSGGGPAENPADDDATDDDTTDNDVNDDDSSDDDLDDDADDDLDDDSDDDSDDDADDDLDDDLDDDADDDTQVSLAITSVDPPSGGASVNTPVTIVGAGFDLTITLAVDGVTALDVAVVSDTVATATFPSVELTDRGLKDVTVMKGYEFATLEDGFEYVFDEDPIVFVHGFLGDGGDFDAMVDRFVEIGYPTDALFAVSFSDNAQSNIDSAEELDQMVDAALALTGADRVDMVAHSMGGLSSRYWIAELGGWDRVRDCVSLAGTRHGNWEACVVWLFWESARELCPAYADEGDAESDVQYLLNGDPDVEDVDETPHGVEDGGGISWHAMWAELDEVVIPNTSACLNQTQLDDCDDPMNVEAPLTFHMGMLTSEFVSDSVETWLRARNAWRP